jgi:aromatic ring hydroxylase
MRSGADYLESLKDGRRVWVLGEGRVDDVATHPATAGMVRNYVEWYDRHFDPAWQDILLTPPDQEGKRRPVAFEIPRTPEDLRQLGRAVMKVSFLSGGNVTHTPGYGALIALGILDAVIAMGQPPERIQAARKYRDLIAETGRFITFAAGVTPPGDRFREPHERAAVRLVKETAEGVVVDGMVGLHTAVPYVEDVFITGGSRSPIVEQRVWFAVSMSQPGVQIVTRKRAARSESAFVSPFSGRYDELDGQLWLENVLIPWDRVFAIRYDPLAAPDSRKRDSIASWLFWHQLMGWQAHAEFNLGLALALVDALGLRENQAVIAQVMDLVTVVQTARSCLTAAELDPDPTYAGHLMPGQVHIAAGSLALLRQRALMAETVRNIAGQAGIFAPADSDFADEYMARELERAFGGGVYTAKQRAALLQLVWEHTSSGLESREAAFEHHANGGIPAQRNRLQRNFDRYNELANGVVSLLAIDMPPIDLDSLRDLMDFRSLSAFGQPQLANVAAPTGSPSSPESGGAKQEPGKATL